MPDRAGALAQTPSDGRIAPKVIDNGCVGIHEHGTLQNVAYNVNTKRNASPGTVQTVTSQGDRLLALQTAAGFSTLAEFARAAGVEPGTARQQVARNSVPKEAAARYISVARGTGATLEWLLFATGPPPKTLAAPSPRQPRPGPSLSELPVAEPIAISRVTPVDLHAGPQDIPVWASAQAGDDGAIILTPDPIDYIRRSERMRAVKNPFAFYVIGGSMSPAVEPGMQVVVNPALPPAHDRDHVFIQDLPDGTMKAMIKRLLRQTATVWRVRQFNPPRDFDLPKATWPKCYRISEKRED